MINTSLLITNTANQAGMNFMIAKVMKAVERSNLSAIGSKYAPKRVFLWQALAIKPSTASLIPATAHTNSALTKACSIKNIRKTGIRSILKIVIRFGMFMITCSYRTHDDISTKK